MTPIQILNYPEGMPSNKKFYIYQSGHLCQETNLHYLIDKHCDHEWSNWKEV